MADAPSTADPPFAAPSWPADKIERWSTDKIFAYGRNARTHSDAQVSQIAASMREFGWTIPILVDEQGLILAGHGRAQAAAQLGIIEVPVMIARGWTDAKKKAYRLLDNQLPMNAGWNMELLKVELNELAKLDYPLALIGFDDLQLVQFMASPAGPEAEQAPEPPVNPVTRRGDLWVCGDHRVLCGDATSESDVAMAFGGAKATVVIEDPPYGVNYSDIRDSMLRSGRGGARHNVIENDELDGAKLQAFLEAGIRACLPHLIDRPAFYLWHPMLTQGTFFAAAAAADILIHRQIIWVKPSLILGRGDYHWRHELCFYGWIRGKRCTWYSGRDQTTVWEIGRENEGTHPTQKPIDCMKRPIENNSRPGDVVFDGYLGSGTTVVAAEISQRRCVALEIDPVYCDVAVERWAKFAGKTPILEATGQTFAEVQEARYDGAKDAVDGYHEGLAAVRARKATGGPSWTPGASEAKSKKARSRAPSAAPKGKPANQAAQ